MFTLKYLRLSMHAAVLATSVLAACSSVTDKGNEPNAQAGASGSGESGSGDHAGNAGNGAHAGSSGRAATDAGAAGDSAGGRRPIGGRRRRGGRAEHEWREHGRRCGERRQRRRERFEWHDGWNRGQGRRGWRGDRRRGSKQCRRERCRRGRCWRGRCRRGCNRRRRTHHEWIARHASDDRADAGYSGPVSAVYDHRGQHRGDGGRGSERAVPRARRTVIHHHHAAEPNASGCGNTTCSATEEATWALGTLAAGTTQTIQVSASVLGTVGNGSTLASLFRLNATGINTVTLTKNTEVRTLPAAELTLGASADPVIAGQSVELTLDVGQIGDMPLSNGSLKLYLPAGLQATTINDGGTTDTNGAIVWPISSLDVGSSVRRTITATVAANVVAGDVMNPRATLEYDGGSAIDHVAQVPVSVVAAAPPLTLTLGPATSSAVPGGRVLYYATVANRSLRAIDGVTFGFRVPRELSFVTTTDAMPNANGCGNTTCSADEEASWTLAPSPQARVKRSSSTLRCSWPPQVMGPWPALPST